MSICRSVFSVFLSGLPVFFPGASFAEASPEFIQALALNGLETRSAALILSGEEGGELALVIRPVPVRAGPDGVRVALVIDIDEARTLSPSQPQTAPEEPLMTEVYAYAIDAAQDIGGFLAQAFTLEPNERRSIRFFGHLDLTPGEYSLRVLVVQHQVERLGLGVLAYTVPEKGEGLLPEPLAPDAPRLRILARGADFPWRLDLIPLPRPPRVKTAAGGEVIRDLASGGELSAPHTETAAPSIAAPAQESPARARRRMRVEGYQEALRHLVAGRRDTASTLLAAMERAAFQKKAQDTLPRDLLRYASRLSRLERKSLVPLIEMHERLYREHHQQREYQLATHARQMVLGLAELFAYAHRSETSNRILGCALASVGGYLQELGSVTAARTAFEDALGYDGASEAALLGIAAIDEAYGFYERAADLLKQLLEVYPENAEARLRRAVCLSRLGQSREAEKLFRHSLETRAADWIHAVAYQELADLYLQEHRSEDAVRLLAQSLERLPDLERLYLQLAAVYDHLGRRGDARATLALLNSGAGRASDTPRLIYSRWPHFTIAAARRVLAETAAAHLEILARTLEKLEAAQR